MGTGRCRTGPNGRKQLVLHRRSPQIRPCGRSAAPRAGCAARLRAAAKRELRIAILVANCNRATANRPSPVRLPIAARPERPRYPNRLRGKFALASGAARCGLGFASDPSQGEVTEFQIAARVPPYPLPSPRRDCWQRSKAAPSPSGPPCARPRSIRSPVQSEPPTRWTSPLGSPRPRCASERTFSHPAFSAAANRFT